MYRCLHTFRVGCAAITQRGEMIMTYVRVIEYIFRITRHIMVTALVEMIVLMLLTITCK